MRLLQFLTLPTAILLALVCPGVPDGTVSPTLKGHFADNFLIGAAVNMNTVRGTDNASDSLLRTHFNSIVAENCMKCQAIHPEEGRYFWDDADAFIDYGTRNDMTIIGHTLIWHSQLAPWFAVDSSANYVTADVLKERMRDHITTIMTRYKGKVKGWDVVNEPILDDGSYRPSPFFEILGEEFIPLAFRYAHEADPDAELYINDYAMSRPSKRETYLRIVNDLKSRGLRIDAIGMQGHMGMEYPDLEEFEKSIEAFASTGCKVMVTEWDMSALPYASSSADVTDSVTYNALLNPYPGGLPAEVDKHWNERMDSVTAMFLRHKDVITRVTTWGTHDGVSWKNNHPVKGRTEYPLLFDRNYRLKPFMAKRINE